MVPATREAPTLIRSVRRSRAVALAALRGAVCSELLYSQMDGYDSQIEEIMPALLYNCLNVPVVELHDQ